MLDIPTEFPEAPTSEAPSSQDFSLPESSSFMPSAASVSSSFPVIDIDTDDVENIEDILDSANSLNHSEQESSDFELPLRIIIPSMHMHYDNQTQSYWKYDQFVLKTGNHTYHDHLQNGEKLIEIRKDNWNLDNSTKDDSKIFVGNRSFKDIQAVAKTNKIFADREGKSYKVRTELIGGVSYFELIPIDFDIVKVAPVHQIFGVRHHYEQLNRWLMFKI